jgi:hypothetical protein
MKAASVFRVIVLATFALAGANTDDSLTEVNNAAPAQKYFEVMQSPTKVLRYVNPQSPILGFANKNEAFPLIFAGTTWYQIIYKNDTGWVEGARGRIILTSTVATKKIPTVIIIAIIGVCGLLIVILGSIFIILSLKRQKFKRMSLKRDVLIIAHTEKEIQYSLTDTSTTLSRCIAEIGFKVSRAHDLDHVRNLLVHSLPDVLVIDWRLETDIQSEIKSILSSKGGLSSIHIIFYNVPDPTEMSKQNTAPNIHFIGLIFSDRDIFKIVTPLITTGKTARTFKKSVQSAALEGEIGQGNLVEVMQFIEIGRKTGCLYITSKSPFGIIFFEQGRITYAALSASQGNNGREAVNRVLNLRDGRFHFVLDKVTTKKNVNLSTLEVLMEWTKGKDEALRH